MYSLLPEFFLATSILLLLVYGAVIIPSPNYNYPLLPIHTATCFILIWTIYLGLNGCFGEVQDFFVQDHLGMTGKMIVGGGLLFCIIVGQDYVKIQKINAFEYFILILLSFLGLCILISSNDFLSLYLSLEIQSLALYVLAAFQRQSAFSTEAGLKYFLLGAISSGFILLGISLIYGLIGTTSFNAISTLTSEDFYLLSFFNIIFCLGLFFKLGAAPFHIWVPDVYEGTPTSISLFFAAVPKLGIFLVLLRVLHSNYPSIDIFQIILASLGIISIFFGSLIALKQNKIKRLLAFSGVSHVGYALLSLSCGSLIGNQATILYIFVYILTPIFLWGLVLCLEENKTRTRFLSDFILWFDTNPVLGWSSILVIFSLGGIPPFGGFFAKLGVFLAALDSSFYLAAGIALLISVIGIVYYLGLIKYISIEKGKWTKVFVPSKGIAWCLGISSFILIFYVFFADFLYLLTYNAILI